uniref:Potassium/proton antiporter CemA n=1 Tax=Jenufa minuta TaxID=993092 RepID=A0A0S2LNH9_JENMI|nr:chloroplast enveloppe membrane protein [Jenufa minuta]ALO62939.1 chloroplast enveloppe membrane protein [Jenufa minuta]
MKPNDVTKQQVVSITYEDIGLFPRSFNRVFDRFFKQIFADVENLVIQEYRFYRYLFLTTIKCLFLLVCIPFLVNFLAKTYLVKPITEYFWNKKQPELFLNAYQQKLAFSELENYEEKIYFESLIAPPVFSGTHTSTKFSGLHSPIINETLNRKDSYLLSEATEPPLFNEVYNFKNPDIVSHVPLSINNEKTSNFTPPKGGVKSDSVDAKLSSHIDNNSLKSKQLESINSINSCMLTIDSEQSNMTEKSLNPVDSATRIEKCMQSKVMELALRYNNHSIEAITNCFADFLSIITLCFLVMRLEIQLNITKSFLLEVFFGLDDSKKSLFILFITDLLVGYHSPNIWEFFFQFIFYHYGLAESQTSIFLLVATLPVLLDVLFKYIIFRHLNRASPATVATYHAMIE